MGKRSKTKGYLAKRKRQRTAYSPMSNYHQDIEAQLYKFNLILDHETKTYRAMTAEELLKKL